MGLQIHKKAKPGHIVRRDTKRQKALKKLRNVMIMIVALFVVVGGGGFVYTWYLGEYGEENPNAFQAPAAKASAPKIEPVKRDPNAPIGATIQNLSTPVAPGQNASITVRSAPEASCGISVIYDKTASKDSGLLPKKTNNYGMVSWGWTVDATAPLGKWPVKVTCELNKKAAVVQGDLVVELPKED